MNQHDDTDRKRTVSQNSKMWPMLTDVSRQIDWPHTDAQGNWRIGKMQPMAWKSVLTAGFEHQTQMAQGIDGGTVMVGASTSNYGVRRFAEFIEYIYAAGSERGVAWSEKSEALHRESASTLAPKAKVAA
jgi:hypothetical protein